MAYLFNDCAISTKYGKTIKVIHAPPNIIIFFFKSLAYCSSVGFVGKRPRVKPFIF